MIILKDSIEIKTTPDKIFGWLINLDKHYFEWHEDHVKFEKVTGGMNTGDIIYFEEYLHGKLHKLKFIITEIEPNRKIEYKGVFPLSIICPNGSFIIEPKGKGSIFNATLSFRMGKLFSKLAKNRVEALKKHIKEEGINLKKILEREKY